MAANSYVHIQELRRNHSIVKRFSDWQRWKLWLALFAIVIIYPIFKFFGSGGEFISTFGHGDLLLFSALILIELSVEAAHIHQEMPEDMSDKMDGLIENSRFFGVALIFLYGAMKLMIDHESKLNRMPIAKAKAFSVFCLSVTFLVVSFSIFAFWKALNNVVHAEQ
jgi:hypothetical protein